MNIQDLSNDDMFEQNIGNSPFVFSAVRPEKLGATEYTLVSIVLDTSGSVNSFVADLVKMVNAIAEDCKKSPRKENLLIRLVKFNSNVEEVHGFIPLQNISQYVESDFQCDGLTTLYDAVYSSLGGTLGYAKTLVDQDFDVNGIVYIITDGVDNNSSYGPDSIKQKIVEAKKDEVIGSLTTILIGINTQDAQNAGFLQMFKDDASLTQFVDIGNIRSGTLAHLGGMISKSISSTASSVGSNQISNQLTI
jgi:uncharacterized protein YegL